MMPNPQTDEFLAMLGLDHVVTLPTPGWQSSFPGGEAGAGGGYGDVTGPGIDAAAAAEDVRSRKGVEGDFCEIDLDSAREDPNEIQLDDL